MKTIHQKQLNDDEFKHLMSFENAALRLLKNKFVMYVEDSDLAEKIHEVSGRVSQHMSQQHTFQMPRQNDSELQGRIREKAKEEYHVDIITDVKNASCGVWYCKENYGSTTFYFLEDDDASHFKLTYGG